VITVGAPLLDRTHRFIDELRDRGVPISMVERIDAMRAVGIADLGTDTGLRTALQATLIKTAEHLAMFDEVFDLYFRPGNPGGAAAAGPDGHVPGARLTRTPLDLEHAVRTVLRDGSDVLARQVAEQAVTEFARFQPGRPVAGVMYERWTLEGLRLTQLEAEQLAGTDGPGGPGERGSGDPGHRLGRELRRRQALDRAETLRRQVREVIRERLVDDRGVDAVAKTLRRPLTADLDIAMASRDQLTEIQRLMGPMQRKLATTMMRKRRDRRDLIDVRATVRASMTTGGVPVRLVHRRPQPIKPQLYVLADMSRSVATFASFTITLVTAMAQLFSRLRSFAFIQNAAEVTDVFKRAGGPQQAIAAMEEFVIVAGLGNYTDYGRALRQFHRQVGGELERRSTVLVFGDARGNYLPAEEQALASIAKRAGSVFWLNPEPDSLWASGDSLMRVYEPHCTGVAACRTLSDLRRFIERLE
jgi:uncharacterized protein with von Willebrand factor type A (vWA) domain